jgi:hypothetical protein
MLKVLSYEQILRTVIKFGKISCEHYNLLKKYLETGSLLSGLENRDYGHRGSTALTMRHPFIRRSWY